MKTLPRIAALVIAATVAQTSCKVNADVPVVETLPIDSSSYAYAWTGGNVIDDGGDAVTSRGVCVSIDGSVTPTVTSAAGDVYWTNENGGTGTYSSTVVAKWTGTNNSVRHTHYIRAYATNDAGTGYGEIIKYIPGSKPLTASIVSFRDPQVNASTIIITYNLEPNGCGIQKFALCYNTQTAPTIDNSCIAITNPLTEDPISLTGLTPNQTYYFRIYMKNDEGTEVYSDEINCTTK